MLAKRAMRLIDRKTSVALEPEFWNALDQYAESRKQSVANVVGQIDEQRRADGRSVSLASAVRTHLLLANLQSGQS